MRGLVFSDEGSILSARISDNEIREVRRLAVAQNVTTLRNRVNELGVAEPVIQQQGEDRIVVQLPGVQDTARAKEILGATATLEFRMVDTDHPTPTKPRRRSAQSSTRIAREPRYSCSVRSL